MRKFDLDGVIDPEAADLGETIIKAGLATFPNDPQLLILYANFMMEVRRDSPASRTQLQVSRTLGFESTLQSSTTTAAITTAIIVRNLRIMILLLPLDPLSFPVDRFQAQPQLRSAVPAVLHSREHQEAQGEL